MTVSTLHPADRRLLIAAIAALAGPLLSPLGSLAQPAVPASAVRAINLARTTAIERNGGLSVYRPAQCMFETADRDNRCLISSPKDGDKRQPQAYVFRFMGGAPGWQQNKKRPSVETEISIAADGRRVLAIHYNGKPR